MSAEGNLDIPKPIIKRIVKEKLTAVAGGSGGAKGDVQLNKEALLAFGESAKVFISYITATANDIRKDRKRAALNADDIFAALEELEFQELLPELKEAFEAYKQSTKEKKEKKAEISRKRKSAGQAPQQETEVAAPDGDTDTNAAADNSQEAGAEAQAAGIEAPPDDNAAAAKHREACESQRDAEDAEMQDSDDAGADGAD